jgi:hypothetical protein
MPHYDVDIEGTIYPWEHDSITVPQLRELAGYSSTQEMIEVDLKTNTEKVLAEDEVVKVEPGKGFAKRVVFKRG